MKDVDFTTSTNSAEKKVLAEKDPDPEERYSDQRYEVFGHNIRMDRDNPQAPLAYNGPVEFKV